MKAIVLQNKLVKLIAKYGKHVEVVLTTKKDSAYNSFELEDLIDETGWLELVQD